MILGGWRSIAEVPYADGTAYNCTDLVHKKEYKFRVQAINKVGASEYGLCNKTVLAKDPWGT